jgi:organic hydroperoxide reductase OsmC/OhrA
MADHVHTYRAELSWSGSTAEGYDDYDRTHRMASPPAEQALTLSSDPAFRGDASLLNPEVLLVQAATSCQLLSFLAAAAKARIDVVAYEDEGEGEMPEDVHPMHITRIVLRPRITVVEGPTEERIRHLCEVAHKHCYIANSLTTEVVVEPTVEFTSP